MSTILLDVKLKSHQIVVFPDITGFLFDKAMSCYHFSDLGFRQSNMNGWAWRSLGLFKFNSSQTTPGFYQSFNYFQCSICLACFSINNLKFFRTFFLAYPNRLSEISHPVGDLSEQTPMGHPTGDLSESDKKFHPNFSWSHYRALISPMWIF